MFVCSNARRRRLEGLVFGWWRYLKKMTTTRVGGRVLRFYTPKLGLGFQTPKFFGRALQSSQSNFEQIRFHSS